MLQAITLNKIYSYNHYVIYIIIFILFIINILLFIHIVLTLIKRDRLFYEKISKTKVSIIE